MEERRGTRLDGLARLPGRGREESTPTLVGLAVIVPIAVVAAVLAGIAILLPLALQ